MPTSRTPAERLTIAERELAAMHKEEELLAQRLGVLVETATAAQERIAEMGPTATEEPPALPPLPQAPIQARVTVETLRRDRADQDHRLAELREERDQLAAHDPVRLREELAAAEAARRRGRGLGRGGRRSVRDGHRGSGGGRDGGAGSRGDRGRREQELA